jgi:S1-C subfamily serine protease
MHSVSDCVIFADALLEASSTTDSIVHVKEVLTKTSSGNQYVGLKAIQARSSEGDSFPDADRVPLYPLQLLDGDRLGIETAVLNNGVVVTRVVAGKLFSKAGVREGDLIIAIDSQLITTNAEARRLLRRKPSETAVLQLTRGFQTLDLKVRFE